MSENAKPTLDAAEYHEAICAYEDALRAGLIKHGGDSPHESVVRALAESEIPKAVVKKFRAAKLADHTYMLDIHSVNRDLAAARLENEVRANGLFDSIKRP